MRGLPRFEDLKARSWLKATQDPGVSQMGDDHMELISQAQTTAAASPAARARRQRFV